MATFGTKGKTTFLFDLVCIKEMRELSWQCDTIVMLACARYSVLIKTKLARQGKTVAS